MTDLRPPVVDTSVPRISTSLPSVARIYDYLLGGTHNFQVDRLVADEATLHHPGIREIALENRAVMRRAIEFALETGVSQFLDIGSGIPTFGNVHEVAQAADPDVRVCYVDNDLVAVAHSRAVLQRNPTAGIAFADFRCPKTLLASPELRSLLDLDRPVALMLVALIHFFSDNDRPAEVIAYLRDALAPGSILVITHATLHGPNPHGQRTTSDLYAKTGSRLFFRDAEEVRKLFRGWTIVEPGIVPLPQWRPDGTSSVDPDGYANHGIAAVAIKE